MLEVGSNFSGMGGLDEGLEKTGKFKTIWCCEYDPETVKNFPPYGFPALLHKQFFNVPNLGDITKVKWEQIKRPDIVVGGFPCQDISIAGKRNGINENTRSGLWAYFAKSIRVLRPRYVLIENVSALSDWFDAEARPAQDENENGEWEIEQRQGIATVLIDLAEAGYNVSWDVIRASEVGANHQRARMFIFAHLDEIGRDDGKFDRFGGRVLPDEGRDSEENKQEWDERERGDSSDTNAAHTFQRRMERFWKRPFPQFPEFSWCKDVRRIEDLSERPDIPKPLIRGSSDGIPNWKERIAALGNAVVPEVAQVLGERIAEYDDNCKNIDI